LILETQAYRFVCGKGRTIVYSGTTNNIQNAVGEEDNPSMIGRRDLTYAEAVNLLLRPMSGNTVKNWWRSSFWSFAEFWVKVSGFGLGFWWGFHPILDCETLGSDKIFWQGIAKQDRARVVWELRWDSRFTLPFVYRKGKRILPDEKCRDDELQRPRKDQVYYLNPNPSSGVTVKECAGWPSTELNETTFSNDLRICEGKGTECPKGWASWDTSPRHGGALVSDLLAAQEYFLATKFNLLVNTCHDGRRKLSADAKCYGFSLGEDFVPPQISMFDVAKD